MKVSALWQGIVGLILCPGFGGATAAAGVTPLYGPSVPPVPIIVAVSAGDDEKAAADELARVLGLMSGLTWTVHQETGAESRGIFIGSTLRSRGEKPLVVAANILAPGAGEVGPDAFHIDAHGGSLVIVGATPESCPFAVAWFLQNEVGVRWYAPGLEGEKIPRRRKLELTDFDLIIQPAYVSRELTGFSDAAGAEWARRNGLRRRLEYSHALAKSFPPELYPMHPEWFPLIAGERYRPSSPSDPNWQPNLVLPAVADHAAAVAVAAFRDRPDWPSLSLGINDSMRFDQGDETRRLVEPLHYYHGMPDYSPLVFTFMNRVAAAVGRTDPGRFLGCLAYFWCQTPPPFPVESCVLPYVASDRSQYYDPSFRRDDLELMRRWGTSGVSAFGLWDYAYGDGFVIPREPVDLLADGIREGWKRGARGYVAEVGAVRGLDAFKAWALARLLWDPTQSEAALEDDFFPGYYGPAAAPMRQFFEACQTAWRSQSGPTFWLKYYRQADQARLFPPETCARLRHLITSAESAADSDVVFGRRVAAVSQAFDETEAFVEFDADRRELSAFDVAELGSSRTEVALAAALGRLAADRNRLIATGSAVPSSLLRDDPAQRLLLLLERDDRSAPRRILKLAGPVAEQCRPWQALAKGLAAGLGEAPNLAANSALTEIGSPDPWPRFLYPKFGDIPARWLLRAMPTEGGRVAAVDGGEGSSRRAIRVEGAWDTQLYQWMPAQPGSTYLVSSRLRGNSSPGSDASLILTFLAADGEVLESTDQSLPKGATPAWRVSALGDLAPVRTVWVGFGISVQRQQTDDWVEAESIELRATRSPSSL